MNRSIYRFVVRQFLKFSVTLACVLALAPAQAAISVAGSKSVTTGSTTSTSLTVTPVAGSQRADLLLVQLTLNNASATVTPPSGWTELSAVALSATGIQQRVFWTIRSNTEPASYAWTFSQTVLAALVLLDIRGVDTNQAINSYGVVQGSGTALVAPEVAQAYTNGMMVSFFGTTGAASSITPQASMTVPSGGQTSAVAAGAGVQLAAAYEQLTNDGFTGVRTATGADGTYIGQSIAITPSGTSICFSDAFNRASLGADWVTSNSKGGFNPTINTTSGNQRLQLTQNANNQATLAVLQRLFPAAGNNVVVTFQQYAYPNGGGTSGADGIVAIFSDANVSPVAGGSGGSLGYAQYSSPANTPGFAGGWLGVGIDEYGNFSNPSENRYLGPGATTNSVSIRGPSNSFYSTAPANAYASGYPYVSGTASLTPIVGSATATGGPGHWYRISIDSRVPGEQWVQVERSTDGGITYTAIVPYFNLMSSLKSLAGWGSVTLPTIPANFWLSFTGGTGGAKNIHEIDNLQVCANKMVSAAPSIDHFRFENPGSMDTCQPQTIKVIACTSAAPTCTQFTGGDVYVTLKPSGWVGGDSVKLIGGKGTLQLAQASTGTVTLDIDKTKTIWPALISPATYASECVLPGTNTATSCNLTVNSAAAGFGVTFPSSSQVACDDSGDVLIKACSSGYSGASKNLQFWFDYVNPATTADATRVVQLSKDTWSTSSNLSTSSPSSSSNPTPIAVTFDSTATARVRVKYADVGQLRLRVRDSAATGVTGSGTFVVRPSTFVATAITDMASVANPGAADATGSKFVAAGSPFMVSVEARNNCAPVAAVKNFGKESTPEGVKLDVALAASLGLTDAPAIATTSDFTFSNGSGSATVNWPEVGVIKLTPRLKSGAYLGTSDVVGTQTGNVGRFYAHHLDTTVNSQGCGAFTYDRQPFASVSVSAMANGGSVPLVNYRGSSTASLSFAKPVTLTDTASKGTFSIGGSATVPVLAFNNGANGGTATLNGSDANHPLVTYTFNINPTVPTTIGIAAADSDNSGNAGSAASALIRSGRVRMSNAYGSERLTNGLPVPVAIEYYDTATSTGWRTCTGSCSDTCTSITADQFAYTFPGTSLTACRTAGVAVGAKPNPNLTLAQPVGNVTGWTDITLNLGATASGSTCTATNSGTGFSGAATTANAPWLQYNWKGTVGNPTARATFGVYKSSSNRIIYRRENY